MTTLRSLLFFFLLPSVLTAQAQQELHRAILAFDLDAVKQAVSAGADVKLADSLNETPLMYAVVSKLYPEKKGPIVKYLLSQGANPNALNDGQYSALHYAAYHAEAPIVKMLLAADASTKVVNVRGETPLHTALRGPLMGPECLATVELLLEAGAPVTVKDTAGRTPLLAACAYQPELQSPRVADETIRDICQLLLEQNAPINATDQRGQSGLYLAAMNRHLQTASFLLEKRAHTQGPAFQSIGLLHIAVHQCNEEFVETVLASGMPANTPLPAKWRPKGASHFYPKNSTPLDVALINEKETNVPSMKAAWKSISKSLKSRGGRSQTFNEYLRNLKRLQGGSAPPKSSKIRR